MGIGFASTTSKKLMKLKLETTEPNKKEDDWGITLIATVVSETNEPQGDIEIIFYHNSKKIDSISTDDDGRAEKELIGLQKGNHTFEAQISGTGTKKKITKILKDDGPKKLPFRVLACPPIRTQEKITQHFQVLAEDNSPVKRAIIRLVNSKSGFTVELPETDKKGCAGIELDWRPEEKCKMLHIQILGTRITDFINIYR